MEERMRTTSINRATQLSQAICFVLLYSRSGQTIFPEVRYSTYYEKGADIQPSSLLHKGEYPVGTEYSEENTTVGRFDYNGSAVDPADDCSVWMISLYGTKKATGQGRYKVVGARVFISPP
jgi:hypothetical protein